MKVFLSLTILIFISVQSSYAQGCPRISTESICFVNQESWGEFKVPVVFIDSSRVTELNWVSADVISGEDLIDFVDSNAIQPIINLRSLERNTWLIAYYGFDNFDILCMDSVLIEVNEYKGVCLTQDPFYPKNCSDTIGFGMLCNGNYDRFESITWYPQVDLEPLADQNGLNSRARAWPKQRTIYNLLAVDDEGCIHHEEHIVDCLSNTNDQTILQAKINVYPNPVRDVLRIDIGNIQQFEGQFVLRNALGQVQKKMDIHSGQRRYQLPVYDLHPGMYFYEIRSEGQSVKSGRVVVE